MDNHDNQVRERTEALLDRLKEDMPFDVIGEKFPISYALPMHSSIHKEADSFRAMLSLIKNSLLDLLANFQGHHPNPYEVEALWNQVS